MKTALIVGHAPQSKGSYSPILKCYEFDFNLNIANNFKNKYPDLVDVFTHDTYKYGYLSMQRRMAQKINSHNYSLALELHFNSSDNPEAHGCETKYYKYNATAKNMANSFIEDVHTTMGIKKRQAIPADSTKDRGGAFLLYAQPTCLILEPFFGTNQQDCKIMDTEKYIQCIKRLINHYQKIRG